MERNIYKIGKELFITSDEEIKLNDYVIQVNFEKTNTQVIRCETEFQVKIANDKNGSFTKKKIILTTDQDLINDGIQAIDDEFLEWFVKNPSCEEVEVEIDSYMDKNISDSITFTDYKIIIPKEEPKQETLEEVALKYFPKTNSHFDRLDEVDGNAYYRSIFKLGAKWQQEPEQFFSDDRVKILEKSIEYLLKRQERMCSEEEFLAFGKSCFYKGFEKSEKDDANCYTAFREEIGSLIGQFKKK